jgi:hypothetical protein
MRLKSENICLKENIYHTFLSISWLFEFVHVLSEEDLNHKIHELEESYKLV